jgi:hypothetical protein
VSAEIIDLIDTIWCFWTQQHVARRFASHSLPSSPCRYAQETKNAYMKERRFYLLSSLSLATPYIAVYLILILSWGYGAKLIREGELEGGATVIQVFFNIISASEGFGQVC